MGARAADALAGRGAAVPLSAGVSSGDFGRALTEPVGSGAAGLSPEVIGRLKAEWESEHERCGAGISRDGGMPTSGPDGIHLQGRLEDDWQWVLVLIGATAEGHKELLGFQAGFRESAQSWRELLVDLKGRGLAILPKLVVGDGALGFRKALDEVFPGTRRQRCWVHKTANVLNRLPKSRQRHAKQDLHRIRIAESRAEAEKALDAFVAKSSRTVTCLAKDREATQIALDGTLVEDGFRPSTTSRPSTGSTSGPRTRSRVCAPRSRTGRCAARAASPTGRGWRWYSCW